jgi:glycine dehydrogenase subunit 1
MPFIPHTENDVKEMLTAIGADSVDALFAEIPAELKLNSALKIPQGLTEMQAAQLLQQRAQQNNNGLNFIGAGAYEHHIPAAVWDIVSRGEFLTAYTPYQAEASQGTLQLIYEYQTII